MAIIGKTVFTIQRVAFENHGSFTKREIFPPTNSFIKLSLAEYAEQNFRGMSHAVMGIVSVRRRLPSGEDEEIRFKPLGDFFGRMAFADHALTGFVIGMHHSDCHVKWLVIWEKWG